jgi:exosortase/archaeosortase family protein
MNPVQEIKTTWQSIPPDLQSFLKRALLIFIIWKLLYHLFLFNGRVIDKPLTDFSAKSTVWVLQWFYPGSLFIMIEKAGHNPDIPNDLVYSDHLYKNGHEILGIADACNALELYILYLGFLMAFPGTWKRKLFFAITGLLAIYISNIIRLVILSFMNMQRISAVEMAHHYIFKLIVYAIIFGLWMVFAGRKKDDKTI